MAYNKIYFKHPDTGLMNEAPVGFSWTTFFFGFFPAMFRGDWKWGLIQLGCAIFTWGISSIIFCFIYNKLYIKDLIAKGYKATKVESGSIKDVGIKIAQDIPVFKETSSNPELTSDSEIKCPHCAETIKAEAKLCKHCGQTLQAA